MLNYLSIFTTFKQNFETIWKIDLVCDKLCFLFIPHVKQDFLTFQAVQECNDFIRIAFSTSQLTFESLLIRSILNHELYQL